MGSKGFDIDQSGESHVFDDARQTVGRSIVLSSCRVVMTDLPQRGEVWWCEPPTVGRRPVVILSRDEAILRLGRALVAPCTTTIRDIPSQVVLEPGDDPVPLHCAANLDSIESVSVSLLVERIGRLSSARMHEMCMALAVAIDCGS